MNTVWLCTKITFKIFTVKYKKLVHVSYIARSQ